MLSTATPAPSLARSVLTQAPVWVKGSSCLHYKEEEKEEENVLSRKRPLKGVRKNTRTEEYTEKEDGEEEEEKQVKSEKK